MVAWRDISKRYNTISRNILINDINRFMGFGDRSFSKLRKLDLVKLHYFLTVKTDISSNPSLVKGCDF